jgi:Domain of Unknown Function with PDB structure (DUF3857)/Transglutaminase-like superfamily
MKNKLCCNPEPPARATRRGASVSLLWVAACVLACMPQAFAGGDAPQWMHTLTNGPLPAHDEKTDAVLLYSETNVFVDSTDRIRTQVREAYKILRPSGRDYGFAFVPFNSRSKVTAFRGWCIPAQGKDYEVKDKDAMEVSPPKVEGSELVQDVKVRVLNIPAPDPGSIIGYEYEKEERPFALQVSWDFQREIPAAERHYSLHLPVGWEFKASWLNYPEVKPVTTGASEWYWVVSDLKAIRKEDEMPPMDGVAGRMIVTLFPPGGAAQNGFTDWQQMGSWYQNLTSGRFDASPEVKTKVATVTASASSELAKMKSLAEFMQHDIRYVGIELGIGGWQPHPAAEVFAHRYGDCKDKATLMRAMLHEIGVDSYYIVINTERGSVTPDVPAHLGAFDHAILAIKFPKGDDDPSVIATIQHPKLGTLLFFDPTDELTPFGQIRGQLQSNYGLLVTAEGGELIELPQQPSAMNSIRRTAKLTLDATGTLKGDVNEMRLGDRASSERWRLRTVTKDSDRIKPIEELLANSLSSFHITHASLINFQQTDQPFGFNYSFESPNYAKNAGNLLLVRPRVIGNKGSGFLETKESRKFPIEFEGPARDTDAFEITIPPGYVVDDIPPPVDADIGFANYHSKTVVNGNVVDYTRTFEVKELSVPVNKAEELKRFYRIIAGDERNTVVLKPAP